jgi:hypothetical protein
MKLIKILALILIFTGVFFSSLYSGQTNAILCYCSKGGCGGVPYEDITTSPSSAAACIAQGPSASCSLFNPNAKWGCTF